MRTYLAVYEANQMAFDSSGNLYIAGEDPNNGYTDYDGRLRLLKAGATFITTNTPATATTAKGWTTSAG